MAAWVFSRIFVVSVVFAALLNVSATEVVETEKVLTLDHSNFTEIVSKHDFIVVEFYAPWCGHCKALAPEYEKAASILSSQDPPIVLAKVDANEEVNRDLATQFQIQGFPTIKILRNGGKNSQDYKGPREADGIADYLKKQVGPASAEIKSVEDASTLIDDKNVFIVGIFPKFSGEEFENFQTLAEKLRSDYTFYHTLDAKVLPRGENVDKPTLRLLKPFDELVVDSQDFQVDAIEKFIKESTIPILTIWNSDPKNHPYINSFFDSPSDKALLFVNFSKDQDDFQSVYYDVATVHKGNGISFLFGDSDVSQSAFQYFGLKEDQAPLLIVQNTKGEKYLKANIKPQEIAPWVKDYLNGQVKPFIKSEPIPEVNDEPVKVVVRDSLEDVVINSEKNVLIEFYAPWCGHCQKLAPILDEVATFFEKESDIIIAKFDATVNDVPKDSFDVQGFPTLYFRSSKGNLVSYEGDRTKDDIIEFIQNNRDKPVVAESVEASDSVKDEL